MSKLYISEFPNGSSYIGTSEVAILPQTSVVDQVVTISSVSAQSLAFDDDTKAIAVISDIGCSIVIGVNPTATTSRQLLQQGIRYIFGVSPGEKVAVIANRDGDNPSKYDDFLLETGLGMIPGRRRVTALGNNADIDTAPADVAFGLGSALYPWMTSATALEIVSASANDAAAGTGARTVLINGLNATWQEISQIVTLNGVTPVVIPIPLYRINSALIMSTGSGQTNAGDITIRNSGGGTIRSIMPAGIGITRQSQYTVPAGYTLSVNSIVLSINRPTSQRDASISSYIGSPNGFYRMPLELSVDGNTYRHDGLPGIIVPEKTDFGLRCTYVSAINTNLTAAWLGVLSENPI